MEARTVHELLIRDAKRVATIATLILSVGWAGVILTVFYGAIALDRLRRS